MNSVATINHNKGANKEAAEIDGLQSSGVIISHNTTDIFLTYNYDAYFVKNLIYLPRLS